MPGLIAGLLLPHWLPEGSWIGWPLLALIALAVGVSLRPCRGLAWAAFGALLTFYSLHSSLQQRIIGADLPVVLEGRVISLVDGEADYLQFIFVVSKGPWGRGSRRLKVSWYDAEQRPRGGERWRLPLRLRAPWGRVNFHGSDQERYWTGQGIHGLALVAGPGTRLAEGSWWSLSHWRSRAREKLQQRVQGLPGAGLVPALALADRSGLPETLQLAMSQTGTRHLLAISGLHVGLVGAFAYLSARGLLLLLPLPACWPARQRLALWLALPPAALYALMAGLTTSPRRALIMYAVTALALASRRWLGVWRVWTLALGLVLLADPLAPLQSGFWLSFLAVATLLAAFRGRRPVAGRVASLIRAQVAMLLVLSPLSIYWFQELSLHAVWVNLLAIPWVSVITLPLTLATLMLLPLEGPVGDVLAHMAAASGVYLARALEWAAAAPGGHFQLSSRGGPATLLAMLGGVLLLWPSVLGLWRYCWILYLPLCAAPGSVDKDALRITLLDLGQGQAALLETHERRLLVDAGPGMPGRWDLVHAAIAPALRAAGGAPDLIVISHGDLDHAGGLGSLRSLWPDTPVIGNFRQARAGIAPCHDGMGWNWGQIGFQILHPTAYLPYLGNDSSCVLSVRAPGGTMLLPGDITARVEQRLAQLPAVRYQLLLAPHHGSNSSSSDALLDWARPVMALAAAGYENRFGFPHETVRKRYQSRGIPLLTTGACGAIALHLSAQGQLRMRSARRQRANWWRQPPAPDCP